MNADPGRKVYQKLVPLTPFVPSPTPSDPRRDIFVKFDAWGRLADEATATLSTYGHVMDEFEDRPRVDALTAIAEARAAVQKSSAATS